MFFFNLLYLIFALPALMLGLWAQWCVQSAVNKYSVVGTGSGLTGAQNARRILDYNGLRVEQVDVFLNDHYDPRVKVLRLSPEVYKSQGLAAAHESGHALQDQLGNLPLQLRRTMVLFTVPIFGTTHRVLHFT